MLKRYVNITNIILLILLVCTLFVLIPCNKSCNNIGPVPVTQTNEVESHNRDAAYADTIEFLNGQIELKNNQLAATKIEIDSFNLTVKLLKKKYKPVTPAIDTNVTIVPNEYISNCADCFAKLDAYDNRISASIADYNELNELYIQQAATYENQLIETQLQRDSCYKQFNKISQTAGKYEPAMKIKLGIGAMSINSILPNAIGPGLMYEDKKGNDYIGRVYLSEYGKIYSIDIFKTISFRKRRNR